MVDALASPAKHTNSGSNKNIYTDRHTHTIMQSCRDKTKHTCIISVLFFFHSLALHLMHVFKYMQRSEFPVFIDFHQKVIGWSIYFDNWLIFWVVFQGKMPKMSCFQLLKCEDMLLFYFFYILVIGYLWVVDCWLDKINSVKISSWAMGNCDGHFLLCLNIF